MKNLMILAVILVAAGTPAAADTGWLLERADAEQPTLQRAALQQSDFGSSSGGGGYETVNHLGLLKPVLLSALMPGLGEVSMGYKRGYAMMAVDIAAWLGVKHYHDQGGERRDAYIAFAEEHWSETKLANAFGNNAIDYAGSYYYGSTMGDHPDDYEFLSLWVSRDDDYREFYENLGKWDQFVFGWDDFADPRSFEEYRDVWSSWGSDRTSYLKDDQRVSGNRLTYRGMRADSNASFDRRDQLVYLNMATRIFSIFQVAYLGGVFSDGQVAAREVGGHPVALIAEPRGLTSTRLGVAISY